jgi:hypothetical protein
MIDPVSAFMMASAAFNGVKQLVKTGREIEDVVGQIGKWYGAAADFQKAANGKKNVKPKLFGGVTQQGSIEEEALTFVVYQEKIWQQEKELKPLIYYRYGEDAFNRMMAKRTEIAKEREKVEKERRDALAKFWDDVIWSVVIFIMVSMLVFGGYVYFNWVIKQPEPIKIKKKAEIIDRRKYYGHEVELWQTIS